MSRQISRLKIFLISFGALLLTVPWFFIQGSKTVILGFPVWALFSISMTVLYAVIIAFLLGRYWKVLAGECEKNEERDN